MNRYLLAAAVLMSTVASACAQAYNPAGPSIPGPAVPATPPAATPGMEAPPPLIGRSSATDPLAVRPGIGPGSPARETSHDRAVSCSHQAAALGVAPGASGQYTRECMNSR